MPDWYREQSFMNGRSQELRSRLLDAAERLVAERELSGITVREISSAAGLSAGVLYNYFPDKNDLLLAALVGRYTDLLERYEAGLPEPGSGEVDENLASYAQASLELYADFLPLVARLLRDPPLLQRFLAEIHTHPLGVHRIRRPIADYLAGEQRLGRLADVDVDVATDVVHGSVAMLALNGFLRGGGSGGEVAALVETLTHGLSPRP